MPPQPLDHEVAPGLVLGRHRADARLVDRQGARGGVLDERGRAAARLLQDQQHRRDHLGRPGEVADAPAGHRVGLRQAVDQDGPLAGGGRQAAGETCAPAVVDERLVDLVAEDDQVVRLGEVDDVAEARRGVSTVPTGFQGVLSRTARARRAVAALPGRRGRTRTGRRGASRGRARAGRPRGRSASRRRRRSGRAAGRRRPARPARPARWRGRSVAPSVIRISRSGS